MKKILITTSIIFVVLFVIILGYIYILSTSNTKETFSLLKTKPINYSKEVNVSTEITFEFSKPLSKKESTNIIEVIPNSYFIKSISDTVLILKPNANLKENTQYTIKISNIESIYNEKIDPITFIFTTGKDTSERTSFIRSLPHQGDGFYIKYDDAISTFIVTIQKNPYDKYKQNAIDYLISNKINTNTEKIQYEQLRYLQGNGAPPG